MKIKISEMLDNSVEILTKEKADIDNLKDIQDMVYKKIIRQKNIHIFKTSGSSWYNLFGNRQHCSGKNPFGSRWES